ncbi:hypothetical protein L226DRAFT_575062 [Lentinus tigrinus ALCF2SS1-7]|uniref:ATP-dependent DNA helicase RecQ zinc-binding domain-containing protein n=1 Tax=Lentinus tigrinus ALCF2SS1-6 TaxID=1328759 RepID=A0A5C2RWG5_9APHY|nr:hypothetical protein L227DRAFT_615541 [Lentinus tigrinus ALCF2SS1-6]RPD70160.1 hypothetical protein L226DRAFT_575062 [Lentinus tigrinus ALCF2SS1-7]
MDVRSLKTVYDPNGFSLSARPNGPDVFSVEAFASRVQALIADDRALIERLIRFAQAHDLIKKNAERAQKLAQESNAALETYQKQVKMLEERNVAMISKQTALHDEVQNLQEVVDRITQEKLELETQAAEQAETCRQLTDANNSLSARVLKLAEENNSASIRKEDHSYDEKRWQEDDLGTVARSCMNDVRCRRRQQLLSQQMLAHFGEKFNPAHCNQLCNNCRDTRPITRMDHTDDAINALQLFENLHQDVQAQLRHHEGHARVRAEG